jgi:hypothetical protein
MTKTKKERERLREQQFLDSYNGSHLTALYCPETMDALGKLLAVILGWNGLKILELCAVALTKALAPSGASSVPSGDTIRQRRPAQGSRRRFTDLPTIKSQPR